MEKLELKLTLTSDSTPELLRYLSEISSVRDRAFILKRLATIGLSMLGDGARAHAVLLPTPAVAVAIQSASAATGHSTVHTSPSARPVAPAPALPAQAIEIVREPTHLSPDGPAGFDFLDVDALNAATARFD